MIIQNSCKLSKRDSVVKAFIEIVIKGENLAVATLQIRLQFKQYFPNFEITATT